MGSEKVCFVNSCSAIFYDTCTFPGQVVKTKIMEHKITYNRYAVFWNWDLFWSTSNDWFSKTSGCIEQCHPFYEMYFKYSVNKNILSIDRKINIPFRLPATMYVTAKSSITCKQAILKRRYIITELFTQTLYKLINEHKPINSTLKWLSFYCLINDANYKAIFFSSKFNHGNAIELWHRLHELITS